MREQMKEEWRPVRGKEEYAEISNYGLIHYYGTGRGRYPDERWTYGYDSGKGYLYAYIGGVDKGVHIWVYETFNEVDVPKGYDVNHIDEDKHNNCVWNLNLMTHGDNMRWGTGIARSAAAHRGKKQSSETIKKRVAKLRGRKLSSEHKAKLSATQTNNPNISKAVQALDKDGNVVMEFPSTREAGRQGFDQSAVAKCGNGKLKSYKGYIWRYA